MSYLQDQYSGLALKSLEQVTISNDAWSVLEKGLQGFGSSDVEDNLPITVARFKPDKSQAIMDWASAQKKVRRGVSDKILPVLSQWKEDVIKLDRTLFGVEALQFSSNAIGLFSGATIAPALHSDRGQKARIYICRLNALAPYVIKQAEVNALPEAKKNEVQSLIQCALDKGNIKIGEDIVARQSLMDGGILRPAQLGDVVLLSGDTNHCSAPVSSDAPSYSAFLRLMFLPK